MTKMKYKIPFKSKLYRYKNIENKNKAFEALSNEDKRKEIAFDGLMLVLNKLIKPANGEYWDINLRLLIDISKNSKELQEKLLKNSNIEDCRVCQRGLMMVSQIRLANSINPNSDNITCGDSRIIEGFSLIDFKNMESLYEGLYESLHWKSSIFCKLTTCALANICCNVIHNGNFDKDDETNYLKLWNIPYNEIAHEII